MENQKSIAEVAQGAQGGQQDEQFDIVWVLNYLYDRRKGVLYGVLAFFALAMCLYAFKPKVYTTSCTILPTEKTSGSLGGLSSLASMAGVNIGSMSSSGGKSVVITPDLYPMVSTSTPTLLALIETPVEWTDSDVPMSAYEHFYADTVQTVGKVLMKYTINLPSTIKSFFSTPRPPQPYISGESDEEGGKVSTIQLDKVRRSAINWMSSRVNVVYDDDAGVVNVSVDGDTPEQSAALAAAVLEQLQSTITDFKTRRARTTLNFMQTRYDEAVKSYEKSRAEYLNYTDRHRDYVLERTDATRQKMEDKYNLDYALVTSLQSQVETARMQLVDDTPVFAIVEPVVKPDKKSSPKLLLHAAGGILIGFIVIVGWYLMKISFYQFFDPQKYQEVKENTVGLTVRR